MPATACAQASPITEFTRPSGTYIRNTPIADTIGGVTSAARMIALSSDFPGITCRTSANAAGTPTSAAIDDASNPTLIVTQAALSHSGSFHIFWYHCGENPGGGK